RGQGVLRGTRERTHPARYRGERGPLRRQEQGPRSMRARIVATGSAVPRRILRNSDLERMVATSGEWIVGRTGIRERRVVDDGVASSGPGPGAHSPSAVARRILRHSAVEHMGAASGEWIAGRTGIRERRVVDDGVASSDLGTDAAPAALAASGWDPADLDLILVATCTPDMP